MLFTNKKRDSNQVWYFNCVNVVASTSGRYLHGMFLTRLLLLLRGLIIRVHANAFGVRCLAAHTSQLTMLLPLHAAGLHPARLAIFE